MLWPDEPDRSARRLSVLLSTVRNVFDPGQVHPADHYVAADHDTVWLVREHVDIDVEQFIAEAAEGRRRLAAGDTERAAGLLNDAAARYLGEFCADDPYADWAAGLRELAEAHVRRHVVRAGRARRRRRASTARRSAAGCGSSTSIRTTRTPTSA